MDGGSQRSVPDWAAVAGALDVAQAETEALAGNDVEKVMRRFGLVIARMELKRLFGIKEGEGDG